MLGTILTILYIGFIAILVGGAYQDMQRGASIQRDYRRHCRASVLLNGKNHNGQQIKKIPDAEQLIRISDAAAIMANHAALKYLGKIELEERYRAITQLTVALIEAGYTE